MIFNDQLSKFEPNVTKGCPLCIRNRVNEPQPDSIYHLILSCNYYRPVVNFFKTTMNAIDPTFNDLNILFGATHDIHWIRSFCNLNVLFFISTSYLKSRSILTPTPELVKLALSNCLEGCRNVSGVFESDFQQVLKKYDLPANTWIK